MEFEEDIPDLPDLVDLTNEHSNDHYLCSYVEDLYKHVTMTPDKIKEKNLEKRLIPYLYQITQHFNGRMNFTHPGLIYISFNSDGIKPKNQYNFYFESGIFRCNNQLNYHQESAYIEIDEKNINDDTFLDDIIQFITSIKIYVNSTTKSYTSVELTEFSNPF